MSKLLESVAVARRSGDEAEEILAAYTQTPGLVMALNRTKGAEPKTASAPPNAAGAIDPLAR